MDMSRNFVSFLLGSHIASLSTLPSHLCSYEIILDKKIVIIWQDIQKNRSFSIEEPSSLRPFVPSSHFPESFEFSSVPEIDWVLHRKQDGGFLVRFFVSKHFPLFFHYDKLNWSLLCPHRVFYALTMASPSYFGESNKKSEVNELKKLLDQADTQREPKKYRQVVQKVIACMTLGMDMSSLFMRMIKVNIDLLYKMVLQLAHSLFCSLSLSISYQIKYLINRLVLRMIWFRRSLSIYTSVPMQRQTLSLLCWQSIHS